MYGKKKSKSTTNDFPDDEAIFKATSESNTNLALSQRIPDEYLYNPFNAEPKLDHLRAVLIDQAERNEKESLKQSSSSPHRSSKFIVSQNPHSPHNDDVFFANSNSNANISLSPSRYNNNTYHNNDAATITSILSAAEKDVNEHLARIKAVIHQDPSLLETYSRHSDTTLLEINQKLNALQTQKEELQNKSMDILKSLSQNISAGVGVSGEDDGEGWSESDVQQARLDAWEKALEWYIYCPPDKANINDTPKSSTLLQQRPSSRILKNDTPSSSLSSKNNKPSLTLHQLLQHLTITCITKDDETNTAALEKATQMCHSHLEKTTQLLLEASENTGINYEVYAIHLMAHSLAAQTTMKRSEQIQNQYLLHGREALRIGSALEMAEAKRRQSDNASLLIRRWWMMENLAEQEELSGEEIRVNEEVRGIIPSSSCRMDPLFTKPEYSLEAAKALKSLRMVVRCRSSSTSSTVTSSNIGSDVGGVLDPQASRRFELTDRLIQRTSASLEQRLLNTFSEIYASGGTYDFSSIKAAGRPGRLDWISLRDVAEALMNFDSGRSLHKKYVDLVVSTQFPDLLENSIFSPGKESGREGEEKVEFDVDATRSKLSNLFHHVCEVLTKEFKLIAHVFSPTLPQHLQEASSKTTYSTSFTETYPLQVARSLLQRIISDRYNGMQAQINELLESIDQKGDSDSGAQKLDTFVVIHEKAAGLFSQLKDAAKNMWGPNTPLFQTEAENSNESLISNSSNAQAVASLTQFLSSQEKNLSSGQRRGYFNLELRLLHHDCCMNLDQNGGKLMQPMKPKEDTQRVITGFGGLADYRAPIVPLDKNHIKEEGFHALLNGPLKQSVSRQPLIHATNALARARLMFGIGSGGGDVVDSTARVVLTIFTQMCNFYGQSYLYPILESLTEMIVQTPPSIPPTLPFDETARPHDLGVDGKFWVSIERIHSAAKSFERELWAENRTGSMRVWEILVHTRSQTSLTLAKERRIHFFQELEERGEAVILRALDALSAHIQWILVAGGESLSKPKTSAGTRLFAGSGGVSY